MSEKRSGGALLVACLQEQGVDTVFGVPGESYLAVLDGLYDASNAIRTVICRNEGGAGFMAAAHGKLTGRPGICFVTRGPGASNASIAVHSARQDSSPMILFIGQVGRGDRGREAFQEIDYRAFFGSVAKWVTEVEDAKRLPEIIARAFQVALNGRPGPVVIALPEDMLRDVTTAEPLPYLSASEPGLSEDVLAAFMDALEGAERPLVLFGGGSWRTEGRVGLKSFLESHDIPALAAFRFQDLLDNHSPAYCGDAGVGMTQATRSLFDETDLVIAIGTRLDELTTEGYSLLRAPKPVQQFIHVHPSDGELGKVYQPDLAIHCGVNNFCQALAQNEPRACRAGEPRAEWRKKARANFLASLEVPAQPGSLDMAEVMKWLRANLPLDAILTNGAGNFTVWPNKFYLFGENARLLAPQSGAMGYGLPAAIAAKISAPERVVVCFAGDGDIQMNLQELGTAAQEGAQPIILVLNNSMYATIRMHQERNYPRRVIGTTLVNPDFVALAKAYDFHAERVVLTADFPAAFGRAMASKTGALLELVLDPEAITARQTLSAIRAAAEGSD